MPRMKSTKTNTKAPPIDEPMEVDDDVPVPVEATKRMTINRKPTPPPHVEKGRGKSTQAAKNLLAEKTSTKRISPSPNGSEPSTAKKRPMAVRTRATPFTLSWRDFQPKEIGDRVLSCGTGEQIGHPGREDTKKARAIDTLPDGIRILQVEAGGVHSLLLTETGEVFSCGINEKGTVPVEGGDGDSIDQFRPIRIPDGIGKIVQVAAGASFSAAVTDKGNVIGWGNLRDEAGEIENHAILAAMQRGPTVIFERDNTFSIVKIAAGDNHLLMLSENGDLFTFGDASQGQLGRSRSARMVDKHYLGMRVNILEKGKLLHFEDIFAGGFGSIVRARGGRIFVFGLNNFGQLGVPMPEIDDTLEAELQSRGEGTDLRLMRLQLSPSFSNGTNQWKQFEGFHHTIALTDNGQVYGIGRNTDNALGLGTWSRVGDREENWKYSTLERIADLPDDVTGITATVGCAIAWTRSGSAYGWGCDTVGQLGLGAGDGTVIDRPQQIASKHLDGYKIISISLADSHALILAKAIEQTT